MDERIRMAEMEQKRLLEGNEMLRRMLPDNQHKKGKLVELPLQNAA